MNTPSKPHWLTDPHGWFHRIFIREAILSSLLILCFIGVAYTNFASSQSYTYWLWMIPVFGIVAAGVALSVNEFRQLSHG